ncbi:type VI secretion protein VasK, partial [Klebsiella pneumoniae]
MRKNIRLVGFGLLILVILFLIVLLISQINKIPAVIEGYSTWLKIGAIIGISCISCITAQFVLSERHIETPFTPDDENYVNEMYYATAENNNELKKYLQHRYSFFWHRKVRLLLV